MRNMVQVYTKSFPGTILYIPRVCALKKVSDPVGPIVTETYVGTTIQDKDTCLDQHLYFTLQHNGLIYLTGRRTKGYTL
ncbi:hypothetical protein NDU88_002648 [Pleurodeles waltl]|uniref:Uncharacterized protein n=1 Tax=Pleurodeles waltl TaxID=8319 RepID=A0AAV7M179_PLEWA|nr:hypothetical protein NDU88_002648 [Pleurodeles waltl]